MNATKLEGLTVLVVDDEELLREVVTMMLEDHGATVLGAADGLAGVEVLDQQEGNIDLVFLDFSMARLNGYETYLEMEKRGRKVGYLMVSGLRVIPEIQKLLALPTVSFLAKPFSEDELILSLNSLASHLKEGGGAET